MEKKIPNKCKVFLWTLVNNGFLTNNNIQKRLKSTCLNPNLCVLCQKEQETCSHIFLSCQTTTFLWKKANDILRRNETSDNLSTLVSSVINEKRDLKKGIISIMVALIWTIWLERNRRIFQDKAIKSDSLWEPICNQAAT